MLDFFIVLGQVPGTNYFLSFADILWLALVLLITPMLWNRRQILAFQWSQRHLTLFLIFLRLELGLRKLRVNRPAGWIHRTS